MISLGLRSWMRFSAAAVASGCWKVTDASEPILKVFQSATSFWVDWFTVIALPEVVIVPLPEVIEPPVGNSVGESARAGR